MKFLTRDWKTSTVALAGAICTIVVFICGKSGFVIPDEVKNSLITLTVVLIGIFASDSKEEDY